ncbi:ABC transporter ATP-binding protein [soil metagenome]
MIDSKDIARESDRMPAVEAVEVVNVSKSFGATNAVSDINLTIEEGEFFSFLGPSGCGKTTLLRMIAGFENPTEGRISIAGAEMNGVPPHKRPVNMVFQNYALFPHLTLGENVAFGLKSARKFSAIEIGQKVKDALELVRLGQFIDRLPSQISGGQQQRAALARAVVNNPSVLLLDEPLSALDPQIREEMQIELARLQQRLKITFIMVTHDQNEALALSSRIAVFRQGHLEQVASPADIYNFPKTLFVAQFVGQTNVLEGEVVEAVNRYYRVNCNDIEIFASSDGHPFAPGARVALLIKPHSIRFAEDGESQNFNIFEAEILNKSFQGTNTEYLLGIDKKIELRASRSNAGVSIVHHQASGSRVKICIVPSSIGLLPAST